MKPESQEAELVGIAVEAAQLSGAAVGRVDDASEGAAALLGKRVLVAPFDACGQCEVCRRGGAAVCPLAKRRERTPRLRASTRWLVALDDGLELAGPAAAAVPGDVTTAYTLYARTGLSPRDPVVIIGTNSITRFLVEILRSKSITPTIIVDGERDEPSWRDWLLAKGAAVVVNGGDVLSSVASTIAAQGQGNKPLRLIATDAAALPAVIALAGPRSTVTALVTNDSATTIAAGVLAREITLIGVAGPHPDLVVEAAAMCVKGDIDLAGGVVVSGAATGGTQDATRTRVLTG